MLPIGEDNGIVEWVLNTRGMRHCLTDIYTAAGLYEGNRTNRAIQRIWDGAPQVGCGSPGGGGGALLTSHRHGRSAKIPERCARQSAGRPCCLLPPRPALPANTAPGLKCTSAPPPHVCRAGRHLLQNRRRSEVLDEVLQNWPPLFHRWQLDNFTEPAAWLNARLAYTRTAGGRRGGAGWLEKRVRWVYRFD